MAPPGSIRIIAGKWRGRKLTVPNLPGLRPTPDRIRETLFNWLAQVIPGARCLDAFAGTGALGFEALSRGAAHVVMVDSVATVVQSLKQAKETLGADQAEIYQADMPTGLHAVKQPFDVIFLDPPYQSDLLLPTCHYLAEKHYLADKAYIYLEAAHAIADNALPAGWQLLKRQQAGQVYYHLAQA